MKRSELIVKLKSVEPALSVNPIVPVMTQYWFTGEQLMAYNDQIGLAVPFRTNFKGTVSPRLLQLLEASEFEDLSLSSRDHYLIVTNEDNRRQPIRVALNEPDFLFTMPPFRNSTERVRDLVKAIDHCLISVGTDTSAAEYLGVTLVPERDRISLYACDSNTMSRARFNQEEFPPFSRSILQGEFCRQLVRLYGQGDNEIGYKFVIEPDSHALFAAGDITLYGRLLRTNSPLNFTDVFNNLLPSRSDEALIKLPDRFARAIERASIVCDPERKSMVIRIADGHMYLQSRSDNGEEVDDELEARRHPNVSIKVEPKLLKRGNSFEHILISGSCVVMAKGRLYYLVACHS